MTSKITKVQKRDGQIVDFDPEKIKNAIFKALTATNEADGRRAEKLTQKVIKILNRRFKKGEIPHVEQIQDIVEEVLILEGLVKTAKAYILYREQRRRIREAIKVSEEAVDRLDQYLEKLDWEVQENANMAFSLQGLNHYGVSYIIKKYWLNKIYPQEIREAHDSGAMHIHNLDTLGPYCVGWDLYDLLMKGFGGVPGKVESKPAKHFRAALGQIVNFMYTLQGEAAGAISFSNFDTLLAPFIRYDNLSYQQVKQALQEFLFNMAIPTRVGFQSPFTNIALDLKPSPVYAKLSVIIGGKPQDKTYSEFEEEMKIFDKALYEVYMEGDAKGRPFHFPIPTINITKDFPWEDPAFDGIFEASAKYGTNYFANYINSEMKPEDVRSMCPLGGKEKVLIKSSRGRGLEYSSIKNIVKGNSKQNEYWVFSDGKFVKGKFHVFKNQKMMRVFLVNNHEIEMSEEHLNFVLENINSKKIKVLKGKELKEGMYLPYSLNAYEGKGGNRELGFFVGAYAGDGSFDGDTAVIFSLNKDQKQELGTKLQQIAEKYFGAHCNFYPDPKKKTLFLRINSKAAVGLCKEFVAGKGTNKFYTPRVFEMSKEFRWGVIEGHLATDGGGRNRIYTSSLKMVETLNMLAATLGTTTAIYKDDRPNRLGEKPNYAVLIYRLNRKKLEGIWFKKFGKLWVKIKKIKKLPYKADAYCFEVENDVPMFTVGTTGILTHNCRLRLDLTELYNRGGGGLFGSGSKTGCYDEKTEILTENGWKYFKDLTLEDKVFTLTDDNRIELHHPIRLFEYNYEGRMIRFKSRAFDLLVTPNHRMVVDHKYKGKRMFVEAKDFKPYQHYIPKGGVWEGEEKEWFVLPPIVILQGAGLQSKFSEEELQTIRQLKNEGKTIYQIAESFNCSPVTIFNVCTKENYGNRERVRIRYEAPPLKIRMDDWLKFFGFWLAEGSTDNEKIAPDHGYRVIISQKNKEKREEIKEVLNRLPFNYSEERDTFAIHNKQLWAYLRQFGNKYTKFIPKEIKNLSKRQLKILFDWMVKGDGYVRKTNGQINYWTASKRLADDLQEIILKLGWHATIKERRRKISQIKGREVKTNVVYESGVHRKTKHFTFTHKERIKNQIREVYYKGKVYCCEVSNHTVYVRRNGKATWCGNSIGVVTINLPRIGYLSKTKKEFFERLAKIMDLAKESLEIKRKVIENFIEKGLYPYSRYYLQDIKKMRGKYWANHFSTIGLVGMNECLLNFMGENIASKRGRKFALEVLDFMRERLVKYQEETGNIYNLEATPAESTAFRLTLKDKEKYPDIITAGTKKVPYYTNSSMLPVNFTDDLFEALKLQDEIQCKYTGGVVFHIFLGERMQSGEGVKRLVKKVFENFKLPYITITPTFSICPVHGYIPGEYFFCPKCTIKQPCEVYSRIVGYYRPVQQWNLGKQEEFKQRQEFKIPKEK